MHLSSTFISLALIGTLALVLTPVEGQSAWTNCTTPGKIAITLDDGPHPIFTPEVLDLFKSHNLTTTFFIVGVGSWESNITRYREAILRAYNEGHQIGSHSWSHNDMTNMTETEVRQELQQVADIVADVLQKNLTIFRPPFGSIDDQLLRIANLEFGYEVVNWSIDTRDWSHPEDIDAGLQTYFDALEEADVKRNSFIGIHHDFIPRVVELANRTINYVLGKGYEIVTVAECLGIPMYKCAKCH